MTGHRVVGLKAGYLGLRLPATIGARLHDLRKLVGKLTERATSDRRSKELFLSGKEEGKRNKRKT